MHLFEWVISELDQKGRYMYVEISHGTHGLEEHSGVKNYEMRGGKDKNRI